MNKEDLTNAVAGATGITKKQSQVAVEAIFDGITKALKKGERVQIVGFGSFSVKKRKARQGRNPQTGEKIKIPAKKVAVFSPGAELKKAVK